MNNPAYTISAKAIDLVKDAGNFRSQGVGVFADSQLVHAGASYQFVPQSITDLFLWAKKSDISVKKYFAKFVEIGLLLVEEKNKGRKCTANKQFA